MSVLTSVLCSAKSSSNLPHFRRHSRCLTLVASLSLLTCATVFTADTAAAEEQTGEQLELSNDELQLQLKTTQQELALAEAQRVELGQQLEVPPINDDWYRLCVRYVLSVY